MLHCSCLAGHCWSRTLSVVEPGWLQGGLCCHDYCINLPCSLGTHWLLVSRASIIIFILIRAHRLEFVVSIATCCRNNVSK